MHQWNERTRRKNESGHGNRGAVTIASARGFVARSVASSAPIEAVRTEEIDR